ncbi:hypothetical protein TNCV_4515071 [Trichonephila clavipes]|nr:hypothetical protein TNCV_4515071 [Trichonephila clavipes]
MVKIFLFGTEGSQIESSFIDDTGRAMRTSSVTVPTVHHKSNQAVRHMTQLCRHARMTQHPQTRRTQIDATAHTLATDTVSVATPLIYSCTFPDHARGIITMT